VLLRWYPGEGFEDFLREVAPFLAEPLIVQAVGSENCRFPLAACQWLIEPGSKDIRCTGFSAPEAPEVIM
jgi:hypothetical protein